MWLRFLWRLISQAVVTWLNCWIWFMKSIFTRNFYILPVPPGTWKTILFSEWPLHLLFNVSFFPSIDCAFTSFPRSYCNKYKNILIIFDIKTGKDLFIYPFFSQLWLLLDFWSRQLHCFKSDGLRWRAIIFRARSIWSVQLPILLLIVQTRLWYNLLPRISKISTDMQYQSKILSVNCSIPG